MDLHSVLPNFPTAGYARVIATLEKAEISVKELLLLDALEIAKQTQVPVTDVRRFARDVLSALHMDLGVDRYQRNEDDAEILFKEELSPEPVSGQTPPAPLSSQRRISVLDPVLDAALAGGIRTGYVTEIVGESGCGKTQLLLHLLLAVQLPSPFGLGQGALYISTEGDLPTSRLAQLLSNHPLLRPSSGGSPQTSLENIHSITTVDLESQDHILNFQVPVAIERYNIGLVVVDSITANYRAELSAENPEGLVARARELKVLGHFLRNLAIKHNIAVVVANQVSDQFGTLDDPMWTEAIDDMPEDINNRAPLLHRRPQPSPLPNGRIGGLQSSPTPMTGAPFGGSSPLVQNGNNPALTLYLPTLDTMLALDHQKPFFTGWGDPYSWSTQRTQTDIKAPALGLVWTNQIACRVVLKIKPDNPSNVLSQRDGNHREKTHLEFCPPSSAPLAVVPDSEDSDNGKAASEVPKSNNDRGTMVTGCGLNRTCYQSQDVEKADVAGQALDIKTSPAVGTADPSIQSILASQDDPFASTTVFSSRRIRIMEVVFSPWTSGSLRYHSNEISNDDGWEDIDQGDIEGTQAPVAKYEPSATDHVEFEILPGGIRGLT